MSISIHAEWHGNIPWASLHQRIARQSDGRTGTGYLREAHEGGLSAIAYLAIEALEHEEGIAISASVLRERLLETLRIARIRARVAYGVTDAEKADSILQGYRNFVDFCERLETETNVPVTIVASF